MDSYTSTIQASYYTLKELGNEMPRANIAWNILKGLPSTYDPLISRKYEEISKAISAKQDIDLNKLIAELISEEARIQSFIKDDNAYLTRSSQSTTSKTNTSNTPKSNRTNGKHCSHCHKRGHLEQECFKKYPELRPNTAAKDKENNKDRSSLLYTSTNKITKSYFILDSGATEHWTQHREWLYNYSPETKKVYLANGAITETLGYGNIDIQVYNEKSKSYSSLTISKVYYIPDIKMNLLSIKRILDKGWSITANKDRLVISNQDITMTANWIANLC